MKRKIRANITASKVSEIKPVKNKLWSVNDIDGTILDIKIPYETMQDRYGECDVHNGYSDSDVVTIWIDSWSPRLETADDIAKAYHIPKHLAELVIKIRSELDTQQGYEDYFKLEVAILDGNYDTNILFDVAADFKWDDKLNDALNKLAEEAGRPELIMEE